MVATFDDKIKSLEEQGSVSLKPLGKKIEFKAISLDNLTRITMEDIQNIQALAQWPMLICTKEYQDIQGPLEKDPFFRIMFELLNIPVLADDKFEVCRSNQFKPIQEVIAEGLDPADALVDDAAFINPITAVQQQVQGAVGAVQQQVQGAVDASQQQVQGAVDASQQQVKGVLQ